MARNLLLLLVTLFAQLLPLLAEGPPVEAVVPTSDYLRLSHGGGRLPHTSHFMRKRFHRTRISPVLEKQLGVTGPLKNADLFALGLPPLPPAKFVRRRIGNGPLRMVPLGSKTQMGKRSSPSMLPSTCAGSAPQAPLTPCLAYSSPYELATTPDVAANIAQGASAAAQALVIGPSTPASAAFVAIAVAEAQAFSAVQSAAYAAAFSITGLPLSTPAIAAARTAATEAAAQAFNACTAFRAAQQTAITAATPAQAADSPAVAADAAGLAIGVSAYVSTCAAATCQAYSSPWGSATSPEQATALAFTAGQRALDVASVLPNSLKLVTPKGSATSASLAAVAAVEMAADSSWIYTAIAEAFAFAAVQQAAYDAAFAITGLPLAMPAIVAAQTAATAEAAQQYNACTAFLAAQQTAFTAAAAAADPGAPPSVAADAAALAIQVAAQAAILEAYLASHAP